MPVISPNFFLPPLLFHFRSQSFCLTTVYPEFPTYSPIVFYFIVPHVNFPPVTPQFHTLSLWHRRQIELNRTFSIILKTLPRHCLCAVTIVTPQHHPLLVYVRNSPALYVPSVNLFDIPPPAWLPPPHLLVTVSAYLFSHYISCFPKSSFYYRKHPNVSFPIKRRPPFPVMIITWASAFSLIPPPINGSTLTLLL